MDDVSAMTEAVAAIRNAAPDVRGAFWSEVRDLIDDEVFRESPALPPSSPAKSSVVYYLRFGDRVKIGFSTNLAERLRVVPHDEVLAVERGGSALEHERHRCFADLRITGEWFHYREPLSSFIQTLT